MDRITLTAAEMESLRAELAELEGPRRAEVVEAIATARGYGDLSENFEYHAAKNEQGLLERQITILRAKLDNAVVLDEAQRTAGGKATVGSKVTIEDEDGDRLELLVSSAGGDGAVSPESPMGRAVVGAAPGDVVTVEAPNRSWQARIVSVD